MKTINKSARVETAFGQTLAEPVTFSYTYEELAKGDEIPAKEMPDEDDLRTYVNQKRNAKARASAQSSALTAAGISAPSLEDNQELQLKTMVKVLVAAGKSEEVATQIAKGALGIAA